MFTELIPAIFDGDADYRETVTIVAELHRAWPASLAASAAELAEMVLPHIIERTPL